MKAALTTTLLLAAPLVLAEEQHVIQISPVGSQPSQEGPEQYFTGKVRIDSPFQGTAPARIGGATVTFEPGARTAWHTHPLGQTLIVTAGSGLVQQWGEPARPIRSGDVVWIPPDTKHWHGATANTSMSHIAIAEAQDGKVVDWLEHVSEKHYQGTTQN